MTAVTLNTTAQQDNLIAQYLKEQNLTLSNFVTELVLEKIEDEADLKALRQAQAEDDSYRVSFEDIMKKYAHEL